MQPLCRDNLPILTIFQAEQLHLPWGGDFTEAACRFFSPALLWARRQKKAVVKIHGFVAFKDCLNADLGFCRTSRTHSWWAGATALPPLSAGESPRTASVNFPLYFVWLWLCVLIGRWCEIRRVPPLLQASPASPFPGHPMKRLTYSSSWARCKSDVTVVPIAKLKSSTAFGLLPFVTKPC